MARYRGPKLKVTRRLGYLPGLTVKKNEKPGLDKNSKGFKKKSQPSAYRVRLYEKQKLRYNYGITEKKLLSYIKEARKRPDNTGFLLMQILEMRLDTVIFRLGLAKTIPGARQLINHCHVEVNDSKLNIPSFQCKLNDKISIRNKNSSKNLVAKNLLSPRFTRLPNHLEFDSNKLTGTIIDPLVQRRDFSFQVDERFVIEYYSRLL